MSIKRYTEESLMKTQPISVLHSIAEHYFHDAGDFADRFDVLWESQTRKTGRIKSFVDLLMATECALKAHVVLGKVSDEPTEVYQSILKAGHRIGVLANASTFLDERSTYDELALRLDKFSVFIRYSLDAYETFFPSYVERHEAELDYGATIGNNSWVLEVRALLNPLLSSLNEELTGFINSDIEEIIEHERRMKEFMDSVLPQRRRRGKTAKNNL